ncbi:MAG: site-specific integrase [Clostridia bacterium]|nr:site-specific integrase [Clostridia bacterium]
MPKKGENIYKRKDGRYEGRYIRCYNDSGKAEWGYIYARSYSEVKEILTRQKAAVNVGEKLINSDLSLGDWTEQWIKSLKHIKESTKMIYHSQIKNHVASGIGKIKLKKLNRSVLQEFVDKLSENYSSKSVHVIYSTLKLALQAAHKNRYIYDIYSEIILPKLTQKSVHVLSRDEQKRLENAIFRDNNRYDIGILICLYTGIRIGELCALRWENINLKNGTIKIEQTAQRIDGGVGAKTKINFNSPKTPASERVIPIPNFLIHELAKYKKNAGYILRDNGEYTDTRNISRRFKKLLREADIEDMNFHATRHTFSTRALELGFDAKTLSEILGHASVTTTLRLYAHSLPEYKKNEMERLGSLFNKPSA